MIDKVCPWCNETHPARVTRTDTAAAEWQCSACSGKWTVKDGDTGAYAFFPPDLADIESDEIEPFFVGS